MKITATNYKRILAELGMESAIPPKARPGQWTQTVRKAVGQLAELGIHEAPATSLFEWCEHVPICVKGLDDIGIIHQQDLAKPFNLCVFERTTRGDDEFAEIFERTMDSLDELPQRVEEWRAFRTKTATPAVAVGLAEHRDWLRAVAKDRKKTVAALRESGRLRAAGDSGGAWQAAGFDLKVKKPLPADTPPLAKQRMLEDLAAVAPELLAWHLPRDDKGKWILGRRVPLFRYDGDKRRMSTFCLLVAMPEKRSGRPEIRAEWLQADLQTARLDAVPEMFDTRRTKDFAPMLLGVPATKAQAMWSPRGSSAAASQAIRLQFEGKFEQAAKLAGVELDATILDCIKARRVAHMCTCCAPLDRQLIEWSQVLARTLTAINFPRVATLALRDQELCQRKPRKEPIPLVPFPLQRHIRKAHIALDIRDANRPRLTIDTTGSGVRLPIAAWRRPVDVDLLREGLVDAGEMPEAVKAQLGMKG